MKRFEVGGLNEHLFDVGISYIHQCSEEDGTCEFSRPKEKSRETGWGEGGKIRTRRS